MRETYETYGSECIGRSQVQADVTFLFMLSI